jgi:hypothetical protein
MAPLLRITSVDGAVRDVAVQAPTTRVVVAPADRFVLRADGASSTLRVRRVGDSMVVDGLGGEQVLELNNFFGACRTGRECEFRVEAGDAPLTIDHEAEPIAALADGSFLLHGPSTAALPAAAAEVAGPSPLLMAASGLGLLVLAGLGLAGGSGSDAPPSAAGPTAPGGSNPTGATPPASAIAGATATPPATDGGTAPPAPADTRAPTLTISDDTTAAATNRPVTFTFRFSESVTGFVADDVAVTGGTGGAFAASSDGTTYTLVVTPATGVQSGAVTVSVAAGAAADAAGNRSEAAAPASQAVDTRAPTLLEISDATTALVTNRPVTFTFRFSEPVTGFAADDVAVTNGTREAFAASSDGTTYTLVVTPAANVAADNVSVSVAAGRATDAAGNANAGPASWSQGIDTQAPTQRAQTFLVDDNVTPTRGAVSHTGSTNDRNPEITLTLDRVLGSGETFAFLRDGTVIRTVVGTGVGSRTVLDDYRDSLAAGPHTYRATLTDALGNSVALDLNGAASGTDFEFRVT